MSAAVIWAVSCVGETTLVVRTLPFQVTWAVLSKPVPVPVSTDAEPPAAADAGETAETTGTGAVTRKTCEPETPPPVWAFDTWIEADVMDAMSEASTRTVKALLDT